MILQELQKRKPKDRIYTALGEIMLRLSPPGYERLLQSPLFDATFGGGESNVLVSLSIQGMRTRFISALPDNDIGTAALRSIQGHGVDTSSVILKKGSRLGIYFMEKGADQRPAKVIYDRAGAAINEIEAGDIDWQQCFDGCGWFHLTGITPALSASAVDLSRAAMNTARSMGLIVSLDLNYRAKLWNYGVPAQEVMGELAGYADIIIANEEDCQKSLGIGKDFTPSPSLDTAQYEQLAKEVQDRYGNAKLIAITLRESLSASHNRWSATLFDGTIARFSRQYDISHIVDRVGAGDSFAAGLIYGLSCFSSLEEALEYATAASCLKHSIEGDWNLATRNEITKLAQGEGTGRIQR
jgi:2-dehydro-3-deoxygluconokinase